MHFILFPLSNYNFHPRLSSLFPKDLYYYTLILVYQKKSLLLIYILSFQIQIVMNYHRVQ